MPTGRDEHAEGLMLLRASTLKIIRLQLAIERNDRRVAIEAMDELVALDSRLQDYLETIPATGKQLMLRRELDGERAALNEEKLTLAAEVVRRPANAMDHLETIAQMDPLQPDYDYLGPPNLEFEPEEPRPRRWWLVTVPVPVLGMAAVAYFVGEPGALAWLAGIAATIK